MRQDTNAKFRNTLRAGFLISTLFTGVSLLGVSVPATATVIFQDYFNSGTITKKLNGVPFWINGSQDAPDTYATRPSDIFTQAEADGGYALRVLYVGTPNPLGDARPQLNFELGATTYPELWVSFRVYIPQNYVHRVPSGTGNNKFFIIDNNIGSQYIDLEVWPRGDGSDKVSFNSKYNGVAQGHIFPTKDWTFGAPEDRAKWHNYVLHLKLSTSAGANNGVVQAWKNGALVMDFQNLHEIQIFLLHKVLHLERYPYL